MSWETVELHEVSTFINGDRGKNYPSKGSFKSSGIPFINAGNILENELDHSSFNFITQEQFDRLSSGKVQENDIIFCLRGSLGKCARIKKNIQGAIASSLVIIRASAACDVSYLHFYLKSFLCKKEIEKFENGASQPNLSATDLKNFQIPLPPLPIQKKIAAVLEKADELRRKREEQIKRLDDLLQATFLDMFGDPVTNPKGWPKCSLESLCHKVTDGTHQPPKFVPEGIPFLFVSNIVNGFIDFETEKFISEKTFEELTSRTPIEVGDILYSTVGSYGKAVLVDTTKKFSFQRHIAHIKPNTQRIQAEFLLTQLNSNGVKRQADSQARGIAQKTLNLRELKGFEIFLPPHGQQIEFIKRKRKIDEVALTIKGSCSNNQALFNSLMQRSFKGELTFNV